MRRILFRHFLLIILASLVSCEKIEIRPVVYVAYGMEFVCDRLNKNVVFFKSTIDAYLRDGEITSLHSTNGSFNLSFDNSNPVQYQNLSNLGVAMPSVSVSKDSIGFYWTVNNQVVRSVSNQPLYVENDSLMPQFAIVDSMWFVSFGSNEWQPVEPSDSQSASTSVVLSPDQDFLICTFDSSTQVIVPTLYLNSTVAKGVPLQGFYKDVFMDAGVYLTTRNSLHAASYLGYSLESVSCTNVSDTAWQNTVIGGSPEDLNGRLLYPDGMPRYRMMFVCGGNSRTHGRSLRPSCLDNMRAFVSNGGSYVGTCAGAFFASTGYDTIPNYPYYLAVWPGIMKHSGLVGGSTGLFVDPESPLLNYYDFGGDNYVAKVRHNKGGYAFNWPTGTELLARYDNPDIPTMHGQPAAWAYKASVETGRVIMEGSHPEEVGSGERRDFTAAMLRYAADGIGDTKLKGVLSKNKSRVMDKSSADEDPRYTKIGDLQYHHFAVYIPKGASDVTFSLDSDTDCDLQLLVCSNTFAYYESAEYIDESAGASHRLEFPVLQEGLWYVSVRCLTTVTSTNVSLGQEYGGRTDVLNGVPYTINVTWNNE